jgi:ubiquinone/menaquinone biosynthesis C-methylase UbiE
LIDMAKLERQYTDPRLAAMYDIENSRGPDTDFYLGLAAELDAHRIIDLGCGTGLLTSELAAPGRQEGRVDPAPAMLALARRKPAAGRVEWVEGDAAALGIPEADLLVKTGNVAQVFLV